MVKTILRMKVLIAETAAAACVVAAAGIAWGLKGGLAASAVCLYVKSYEWDLTPVDEEEVEE